jgi:hypothetical protein
VLFVRSWAPPNQKSIEKLFVRNRVSFEKVKSMLEEDQSVRGIATYGMLETNSPLWHSPAESGFPQQRYQAYLALLKRINTKVVMHDRDPNEIRFLVARRGFASSGWGIAIVNREREPNNIIAGFSEFYNGSSDTKSKGAYCRIEEDWYIWLIWF